MKRFITLFLAIITTILCVFALSSCEKRRMLTSDLFDSTKTEIIVGEGQTVVRFYPNESFEYDVADFEKVKFEFNAKDFYHGVAKEYKGFAYPPEGARDNPELQYFELTVDGKLKEEQTIYLTARARGTLNKEQATAEKEKRGEPSIFLTFVVGIVGTLICVGAVSFGLQIWDDPQGKFMVAAANVLPICGNIAVYARWGVGRGIIISVFCAAIIALTVLVARNHDI